MEYIASQENLEAFVRRAASSSVLAIDTEFLREKTYYANLCLIQLATDAEVAVVDPFAIEDMKVLAPLLTDSSIVKLFHAGGQDLEILYRELGVLPAPLFDTQVAATLLGHTQQIGYGPLVHSPVSYTHLSSFIYGRFSAKFEINVQYLVPLLLQRCKLIIEIAHLPTRKCRSCLLYTSRCV